MLCTDIQIKEDMPEQMFIDAWNHLVDEKDNYLPEWKLIIDGDDLLKAYRAKELIGLITETGHIEKMTYELLLKTLDHIEIGPDGIAEIIFLSGTKVKVNS